MDNDPRGRYEEDGYSVVMRLVCAGDQTLQATVDPHEELEQHNAGYAAMALGIESQVQNPRTFGISNPSSTPNTIALYLFSTT